MIDRALQTLTAWFYATLAFVSAFFGLIDAAVRRALSRVGVPADAQMVLIVLVDVVLIVLVARVFGGVIRALLIVFLILLVLHILTSAAGLEVSRGLQR